MVVRNRKVILRPGLPPIPPAAPAPKKKAPPRARRKRKPKPPKPKPKLKRAKKRTLAKRPKKTPRPKQRKPRPPRTPAAPRRRDDQWRLEQMGLAALVVPKSTPREVVRAKRPCANKGNPDWNRPAGSRVYDAILRVMEPGKLYRMGDIRDATGLRPNHVKGYVQAQLPARGLVERVDAAEVARRAGPLVAERLKGYRNLWRLTERGIAEAGKVAEADRRGGGYLDEGEAA